MLTAHRFPEKPWNESFKVSSRQFGVNYLFSQPGTLIHPSRTSEWNSRNEQLGGAVQAESMRLAIAKVHVGCIIKAVPKLSLVFFFWTKEKEVIDTLRGKATQITSKTAVIWAAALQPQLGSAPDLLQGLLCYIISPRISPSIWSPPSE